VSPAELAEAAALHFPLPGETRVVGPLSGGLIHETWLVAADGTRWVLQRLNRNVFRDIEAVMLNFAAVTDHLGRRTAALGLSDPHRRALTLVPARDGRNWAEDEAGGAWRCTGFIADTETRVRASTLEEAREAGRAFGEYTRLMDGFEAPLAVTIPGFHATAGRLETLERAIEWDRVHRVASVGAELEMVMAHHHLAHVLSPLMAAGGIPTRAAHNDAKIANVLFDAGSDHALAVIDLDTVMPGTALHDVGDLIRSIAGSTDEDGPDARRMRGRPDYFAALVAGWFAGAGGVLTSEERALTLTAGRILTFEQAVRFLTDHLDGDRYYPVTRPDHNLHRAQAQLALLADLTARSEELEEIVAST
jgi:hypothetical protein